MFNVYNISESTVYDRPKRKKGIFGMFVESLDLLIVITLLIVIVSMASYSYVSFFSYVDISNNCYIKIDRNVVTGNRETIKQAISNIKYNNPVAYSDICHYVDKIAEAKCVQSDDKSPKISFLNTKGCYIKGTKTIYIEPNASVGAFTVDKRGQLINKYAQESRKYWLGLF